MGQELDTVDAVVTALGGWHSVARLTGRNYSAAFAWRYNGFPATTFLVMQAALAERGKSAPTSLWGMLEPEQVAS